MGTYVHHGYRYVYEPNNIHADNRGYVPEHVLVFTNYYKCSMLKWGIVHHKNKNPLDNSIINLQGMTRSKHVSFHNIGNKYGERDKSNRICYICNSKTTLKNKDNTYSWYKYDDKWKCRSCYQKWKLNPTTHPCC